MKICTKCKVNKGVEEFCKHKQRKDGYNSWCKDCCKTEYHSKSESRKKKRVEYNKRPETRLRANKYQKDRKLSDIGYKMRSVLRKRFNIALRHDYKVGSAVEDLGCSIEEFKRYIECKFQPGMTWGNYGKGLDKWNIDHIKPLVAFDLTERSELVRALHYTNLQPLWQLDNLKKGDRYE